MSPKQTYWALMTPTCLILTIATYFNIGAFEFLSTGLYMLLLTGIAIVPCAWSKNKLKTVPIVMLAIAGFDFMLGLSTMSQRVRMNEIYHHLPRRPDAFEFTQGFLLCFGLTMVMAFLGYMLATEVRGEECELIHISAFGQDGKRVHLTGARDIPLESPAPAAPTLSVAASVPRFAPCPDAAHAALQTAFEPSPQSRR